MDDKSEHNVEWYHKPWFTWFMVLSFGFFAIPFILKNPHLKPYQKWLISVFSVIFSALVVWFFIWAVMRFLEVWRELQLNLS